MRRPKAREGEYKRPCGFIRVSSYGSAGITEYVLLKLTRSCARRFHDHFLFSGVRGRAMVHCRFHDRGPDVITHMLLLSERLQSPPSTLHGYAVRPRYAFQILALSNDHPSHSATRSRKRPDRRRYSSTLHRLRTLLQYKRRNEHNEDGSVFVTCCASVWSGSRRLRGDASTIC